MMTRRARRRAKLDDASRDLDTALLGLVASAMDVQCALHQLGRVLDEHHVTIDIDLEGDE